MITSVHTLGAVVVGAQTFHGVRAKNVDPGIAVLVERTAGKLDPHIVGSLQQAPGISFETVELGKLLAVTGNTCKAIPEDIASVDCYWAKVENRKKYATSGHSRDRVVTGMFCPTRISARQGSYAVAAAAVVPTYDGTNEPILFQGGANLPNGVLDEVWTLGPVRVNGTIYDGLLSAAFTPGFAIEREFGDGDTFPTFAAQYANAPMIEGSTRHLALATALGLTGTEISEAQHAEIWFRKCKKIKQPFPKTDAVHIKITLWTGLGYMGTLRGEPAQPGEFPFVIVGAGDTANDAITVQLGQTIP